MSRYVLSGYYGFGNAGDEAILQAIIQDLRAHDAAAQITVLSADPSWTNREHGVQSVSRTKFGEVASALRQADLFISGGGGLLQDVTSKRSLLYYLGLIKLAQGLGTKVMVYANSLGPVRRPFNRRLTAAVLNSVSQITVRDQVSYDFAREIGVTRAPLEITADPVLLLTGPQQATKEKLVSLAVREWPSNHDYLSEIVQAGRQLAQSGYRLQFIPLHYDKDKAICRRLAEQIGSGATSLQEQLSVEQLLGELAASEVVVGMRLHALIMAAICERPMVGIGYDPKVTGFMQAIGQPLAGMTSDLQARRLVDCVEAVWSKREEVAGQVVARLPQLRKLATENARIAVALAKGEI